MDDPHQVNTIIATAICDALNDEAGAALVGIEQAKQVGKRVVEALNDAGMQIVPVDHASMTGEMKQIGRPVMYGTAPPRVRKRQALVVGNGNEAGPGHHWRLRSLHTPRQGRLNCRALPSTMHRGVFPVISYPPKALDREREVGAILVT